MKTRSTKRALLASLLSLVVCVSMLVGSTFAWFTDSVTSANNIIQSGNLDVELYYQVEGQNDWTKVTPTTNVFKENALWEPGHTEVVKLKVVNEGSLALKYQLGVNIVDEIGSTNVNGTEFKLSEFIKYGIVDGAQNYTRETAVAAVDATANKLNVAYKSADAIQLLPKTAQNTDNEDIVTMVVYMPTTVGNDANHAKGAAVPTINLGINLLATQATVESDSFDDQYDIDSTFVAEVKNADELAAALKAGGNVKLMNNVALTEGEILVIPEGVVASLDLNGKTIDGGFQTGSTNKHVYAIENRGTLTLKNGTVNARGVGNYGALKIESGTYNAIDTNGGGSVWNYEGSDLIINGGTFTAAAVDTAPAACTLNVAENSTAVINGGTFETEADLTYAIISYGDLTVNDATVIGEHGAVAASEGTLTVNGGYYEVTGTSTDHVIYAPNGGVIINDGTFNLSQTNASSLGSTVIDGAVKVNGGTFDAVDGALAYNGETGLVINGGKFLNKATTVYGGGFAQFVAATSTATTNADGSITVTPYKVSSADELADAITNGTTAVSLSNDIALNAQLEVNGELIVLGNGNTITAPASGTRVVNVMDNTGDVTVTLVDVKLDATDKERGISFYNNSGDLDVTIIDCEITAKYYGVNVAGQNAKVTLNIKDSTLTGYCAFQTYSPNTVATFDNCVLKGVNLGYNNTQYPYANNFATVVVNSLAPNSTLTFNNCTVIATEKDSATAPEGQWPATQAHVIDDATGTTINWNNCTFIKNGVEVNAPESIN